MSWVVVHGRDADNAELSLIQSRLLSRPADENETGALTSVAFYAATLSHLYEVANAAFDVRSEASAVPPGVERGRGRDDTPTFRTGASTTADPEVLAETRDAPVLQALEQLRGWLHAPYDELAQVVGLSPSLIHYWRRRHREHQVIRPRASSTERLWRIYAVLRNVAEALDGNTAGQGVQLWVRSPAANGETPLTLLVNGDIEAFEKCARSLIFDESPRPLPAWARVSPADESESEPTVQPPAPIDYGDDDFG